MHCTTTLNRFFPLLLSVFSCLSLAAQSFEWAVGSSGIDLGYDYASIDPSGNIVAGGEISIHDYKNPPELYDATGKKLPLSPAHGKTVVINYSPAGAYNWHLFLDNRNCTLNGIAHDTKGRTALLLYVKEADYVLSYYDDEEEEVDEDSVFGYLPEFTGEEPVTHGWNIVYLDNKGNFTELFPVFPGEEPDMEMNSFLAHPQGGFVAAGFVDPKGTPKILKTPIGKGGGDFVLRISPEGKPEWMQVASYVKNSCCSWIDYNNTISIAPDGTVYHAGRYEIGAVFDGKKTMMAPAIPNETQYNKPAETYLASYSATGKLNWVKTSTQRVNFEAITADAKGVYLSYKLMESDQAFGSRIDTTGGKRLVIARFDTRGTVKWIRSTSTDKTVNMKTDAEGNLYVLGTNKAPSYPSNQGEIGSFQLNERSRMYVAMLTAGNEVKWVKEARLPVWGNSSMMTLLVRNEQQVFVAGGLWSVLSDSLSIWDSAFKAGNGYGGAPFIVKLK